jgi:hypothetical protein
VIIQQFIGGTFQIMALLIKTVGQAQQERGGRRMHFLEALFSLSLRSGFGWRNLCIALLMRELARAPFYLMICCVPVSILKESFLDHE